MYVNIHGTTAPALSAVVQCTNCTIHSYLCGALHQLPSPLFLDIFWRVKTNVFTYILFSKKILFQYIALFYFFHKYM